MTTDTTLPSRRIAPIGYAFIAVSMLEAVTWTGLLIGMYQKYVMGTDDNLVPLFGRLHGVMFLVYAYVAFQTGRSLKWSSKQIMLALAVGVPPLLTVPFEIWVRRKGYLAPPGTSEQA